MRLNLGAGGTAPEGWISLDREVTLPGQVRHDLGDPLPFPDGSVDGAVAHHVVSLLPVGVLLDLLAELHRVLHLGAVFRISDADLMLGVERAVADDHAWFPEPRGSFAETVGFFITQGGARRTVVTPDRFGQWCADVGFAHVLRSSFGHTTGPAWLSDLDGRLGESFYCEAIR